MSRDNPKYFFSKTWKSDKFHKVTMFDLTVLLGNVWKAYQDKRIGFEDADLTVNDLTQRLNHEVWVKLGDLESALWSCNMMSEHQQFWHPRNKTFDDFLLSLLKQKTFNKVYNTIDIGTGEK